MMELFGTDVRTINYHLKEIHHSRELRQEATILKNRIVQKEDIRNVEREVYPFVGCNKVSALEAKLKAESEYEGFHKIQDINYVSDFDAEVRRLQGR